MGILAMPAPSVLTVMRRSDKVVSVKYCTFHVVCLSCLCVR